MGSVTIGSVSELSALVTPKKRMCGPGAGVHVTVEVGNDAPVGDGEDGRGVARGAPGQPLRELFTAAINSSTPTTLLPLLSNDGQALRSLLPSEMFTPRMSSLTPTC